MSSTISYSESHHGEETDECVLESAFAASERQTWPIGCFKMGNLESYIKNTISKRFLSFLNPLTSWIKIKESPALIQISEVVGAMKTLHITFVCVMKASGDALG